jgi:choline dehydrogenase-like flavoprotein
MQEFDVIVIGGGSAGSAVAGRLSEDPRRTVCLLEAGGTNDNFRIKTPAFLAFLPKGANWAFDTVPQKGLNGRIGYQPRGRGLGGSSAINAMLYIRGNKFDYDQWASLGCTGWSYDDVLPYFKRSEGNERGGDEFHGADGPLNVMDQRWPNPGSKAFVASAEALQLGTTPDFNGANQDGFGLYQVTHARPESAGPRPAPTCPTSPTCQSAPARWLNESWSKTAAQPVWRSASAVAAKSCARAAAWC